MPRTLLGKEMNRTLGRAPKTVAVMKENRRVHRSKAELEEREKAESAVLTGVSCVERESTKNDPIAHEEYQRVIQLLGAIGKDDALYASGINRYCMLYAEVERSSSDMRGLYEILDKAKAAFDKLPEPDSSEISVFMKQYSGILKEINTINSSVTTKRRMMFDLEKEYCMTIAAAQRTIPKSAEPSAENDALLEALQGDD